MKSISRPFSSLLDVVSVVLLAAAVWLFWDARTAQPAPNQSAGPSAAASTSRIAAGSRIPAFAVADSAGATRAGIPARDGGLLLYVFRSDCPACAAQKTEWAALAGYARSRGVRTVAYTPEALQHGVPAYFGGAPVEVLRFADAAAAGEALDLRMVPTTFLLGADGWVLHHHQGVMPPSVADSLRRLVGGLSKRK